MLNGGELVVVVSPPQPRRRGPAWPVVTLDVDKKKKKLVFAEYAGKPGTAYLALLIRIFSFLSLY